MLTVLKIQNLALVEDLTWELGRGLVCVTGETGAGKSVIVGALKLVLGERADRGLIRSGEEQCTVEAVFHLGNTAEVNAILDQFGLDPCEDDTLVIKRVIGASGGNRQFVNCGPATLQVLKALGGSLVDLHGPHDHQSLLSRDRQLAMLDAYAGCQSAATAYRQAYRDWRVAVEDLAAASEQRQASDQEIELLQHQLEEIEQADPKPEEETDLEQTYQVASNSRRILELCARVAGRLNEGPGSILDGLEELARLAPELGRLDNRAAALFEGFHAAHVELQELAGAIEQYAGGLETDPAELAALEERIHVLETLKRKYGGSIEAVLERRDQMAARLAGIEGREQTLTELQQQVDQRRQALDRAGVALHQQRQAAAAPLAEEITAQLADLGFRQSGFSLTLSALEQPGPSGLEEADFIFAPNPGEPAQPLRLIASSGEMSRVMLAVKSALARQDSIPLLVFDEIDANVGGRIAQAVGRKMAALAATHQVISITHLPQVAALADRQYLVSKHVEGERTRSTLMELEGEARIEELARMLGGEDRSARAHALTLLQA